MNSLNKSNLATVAVITTTIGREELEQNILSVQAQSYPCQHYVFVDGKQHWHKVEHLVNKYPNVIFTFLPMNTGGKNNIGNGAINAIAPYLLNEDIFCFLDDDNWYEPTHIEYLANFIQKHKLDYAYSLRKIYTQEGEFFYDDNIEALGFWFIPFKEILSVNNKNFAVTNEGKSNLIDTNTYAMTRNIAFDLSKAWYSGIGNDRNIFKQLININARGGCTAKRTVNYRLNLKIGFGKGTDLVNEDMIRMIFKQKSEQIGQYDMPWFTPTLFIDNQLISVMEP